MEKRFEKSDFMIHLFLTTSVRKPNTFSSKHKFALNNDHRRVNTKGNVTAVASIKEMERPRAEHD